MAFNWLAAFAVIAAVVTMAGWAALWSWLGDKFGSITGSDFCAVAVTMGGAMGLPVAILLGFAL